MKKLISVFIGISILTATSLGTVSCVYDLEASRTVVFCSDDWRDGSFRQNIYEGAQLAEDNVKWVTTPDNSTATYQKSYKTFFAYGTQTIVGAGADHRTAIEDTASNFRDKKYILVDEKIDGFIDHNNTTGIFYEVEKAAFIVGYLLGVYTNDKSNEEKYKDHKDIKISGWGGADYQGVNNYLTGLRQGITYFNSKNVEAISKNEVKKLNFVLYSDKDKSANYSGGWSPGANNAKDQAIAKGLIMEKDVDILLPVAASQIQTALSVSKQNKSKTMVIGVDADQRNVYPNDKQLILTSIIKNSKLTVHDAIMAANNEDQTKWNEDYAGKTFMANASNEGASYIKDGIAENIISSITQEVLEESNKAHEQDLEYDWTNNSLEIWKTGEKK